MSSSIQDLLSQCERDYPLSVHWGRIEVFQDTLELEGLRLQLVGLCAPSVDGSGQVTGAAADLLDSPRASSLAHRAYFELLERASILDSERVPRETWELLPGGRGTLGHAKVFPQAPAAGLWRYSKSNGVAAHTSQDEACVRALAELAERDRLLRSWYFGIPPRRLDGGQLTDGSALGALGRKYELAAFEFVDPVSPEPEFRVAGIFGFPKEHGIPFSFGFGSAGSVRAAVEHAQSEFLQRLGFLWGETEEGELPPMMPTPDYHLMVYSRPEGVERIRMWLAGCGPMSAESAPIPQQRKADYVDLTPPHLLGKVTVTKALSSARLPLTFGGRSDFMPADLKEDWVVHPIA